MLAKKPSTERLSGTSFSGLEQLVTEIVEAGNNFDVNCMREGGDYYSLVLAIRQRLETSLGAVSNRAVLTQVRNSAVLALEALEVSPEEIYEAQTWLARVVQQRRTRSLLTMNAVRAVEIIQKKLESEDLVSLINKGQIEAAIGNISADSSLADYQVVKAIIPCTEDLKLMNGKQLSAQYSGLGNLLKMIAFSTHSRAVIEHILDYAGVLEEVGGEELFAIAASLKQAING